MLNRPKHATVWTDWAKADGVVWLWAPAWGSLGHDWPPPPADPCLTVDRASRVGSIPMTPEVELALDEAGLIGGLPGPARPTSATTIWAGSTAPNGPGRRPAACSRCWMNWSRETCT